MNKLSVALAIYNEEENLEDCLNSVKDLAWEIVIVDGGSTDHSLEIAKKFGAVIIQTTNPPIFHINKNKAIDKALGDWILQLDADERVSEKLKNEIKETIVTSEYNGYWIPRRNFFLGRYLKKGGQYPDYTLRLYKRGKGRLPAKDVHEQAKVEGKVGYLKNDLLHLRDTNFSKYLDGLNRYTNLLATQLNETHLNVNFTNFLNFMILKPLVWFLKAYFRNKGFLDGFPGFIFAFFSSLRFPICYIKYMDMKSKGNR